MTDDNGTRVHELQTWPSVYPDVERGAKTIEVRFDDRGYQVGDVLHLWEYDPELNNFTGRACVRRVTHLVRGGQFGIEPGYVAMSIEPTDDNDGADSPHQARKNAEAKLYKARDAVIALTERLAAISGLINPCGAPDVYAGFDSCPCGFGGSWPCPRTKAAWIARGLDPDEQTRKILDDMRPEEWR